MYFQQIIVQALRDSDEWGNTSNLYKNRFERTL